MNYGIELEFFVKKGLKIVPAYEATSNLDGNPIVGEIKTGVHSNPYDLIYDLKKLLHKESEEISRKGYTLALLNHIKVNHDFLKKVRSDRYQTKGKEPLTTYSIYGKETGKILPVEQFKASLQLNISNNSYYTENYEGYRSKKLETRTQYFSKVFNYVDIIKGLDIEFKSEINKTNRVPGVYAIKDGIKGDRIEYRSLPNSIYFDKLLKHLNNVSV